MCLFQIKIRARQYAGRYLIWGNMSDVLVGGHLRQRRAGHIAYLPLSRGQRRPRTDRFARGVRGGPPAARDRVFTRGSRRQRLVSHVPVVVRGAVGQLCQRTHTVARGGQNTGLVVCDAHAGACTHPVAGPPRDLQVARLGETAASYTGTPVGPYCVARKTPVL